MFQPCAGREFQEFSPTFLHNSPKNMIALSNLPSIAPWKYEFFHLLYLYIQTHCKNYILHDIPWAHAQIPIYIALLFGCKFLLHELLLVLVAHLLQLSSHNQNLITIPNNNSFLYINLFMTFQIIVLFCSSLRNLCIIVFMIVFISQPPSFPGCMR
jgi:hypothetical protein